jgi:precorrin-2 dehydrogenase/sirohydrochlorin ferrochelatase
VVSPEFREDFPAGIDRRTKRYHAEDIEDADLVFAATDSTEVNDAVVCDANALGVWVNRADGSDSLPGDFSTPAKVEIGQITVTVSAGSPALAAFIRDALKQRFDPAWAAMADAMKTLRPEILASGLDGLKRAEIFRSLATAEAIDVLRQKGVDGLRDWIARKTPTTEKR